MEGVVAALAVWFLIISNYDSEHQHFPVYFLVFKIVSLLYLALRINVLRGGQKKVKNGLKNLLSLCVACTVFSAFNAN